MMNKFTNTISSAPSVGDQVPMLFNLRGKLASAANDNALPMQPTPAVNDNFGPGFVCDEISAANILAEIFRIAQRPPLASSR